MKQKFSFDLKGLKNIKRSNLLVAALIGILLLVIALPVPDSKEKKESAAEKKEQTDTKDSYANAYTDSYQDRMEKKLTEILSAMDGVGKVEVMITCKDAGEAVVEKDLTKNEETTAEEDSQGTKRNNSTFSSQEETVYEQGDSSSSAPFVTKEVNPQVEGVLVVAEGGQNATVVKNISDAVLALFPIEAHKIKVVKMNY